MDRGVNIINDVKCNAFWLEWAGISFYSLKVIIKQGARRMTCDAA